MKANAKWETNASRPLMKRLLLLFLLITSPLKAEIYDIKQLDLENHLGKVVYLDFWASWCKPCKESFPWMNSLLSKYPADSFVIVTINLDAETDAMHRFLAKVQADFDIYHDTRGQLAEQFEIEGMPASYLIDKNGKVVKNHIGFFTKHTDQYEREIEELL